MDVYIFKYKNFMVILGTTNHEYLPLKYNTHTHHSYTHIIVLSCYFLKKMVRGEGRGGGGGGGVLVVKRWKGALFCFAYVLLAIATSIA